MNQEAEPMTSPLTVLVEFEVRNDTTTMAQWLDVWGARGLDALAGEPETTAYEAAQSEEHERQVLIFERYARGQPSIDTHQQRAAHSYLQETMGARNMTKRRVMTSLFSDIDHYGWWSRPERAEALRIRGLRLTVIVTRFPDEATKARYIKLTGDHANYCWDNEPDTLIYAGGLAIRDADRGPAIRQGDLLFIAAFADEAAAIKHRDDPAHVALQPKLAELNRERILLQTYRTSGEGYLWASDTR
jgi:quinol monooxygenase YgiN